MTTIRSRTWLLALLLAATPFAPAFADDALAVGDARFTPTVEIEGRTLLANGAGMRSRFFLDIYAAALYLPERSSDAAAIIAAQGPARMALVMQRDLGADRFVSALESALADNLAADQLTHYAPQRNALAAAMRGIGEAKKGDRILLERDSSDRTRLTVNGETRAEIEGKGFFAALLRIWIGQAPVDAALKERLLGGEPR